jgi:eukaryotic-like serine/threonine-protein kinase
MVKKSLTLNSAASFLLALFFAGLTFQSGSWMGKLDRFSYGWMVRLTAKEGMADPRIVLIEIDDMNIERMGSWPWPRDRLAEMIDLLKERGVRAVGLNLPLFEKQNDLPLGELKSFIARLDSHVLSEKPSKVTAWIQENLQAMVQRLDGDSLLVESVRKAGNVVVPVVGPMPPGQKEPPVGPQSLLAQHTLKKNAFSATAQEEFEVKNVYLPFPELAQAALGFGHGIDSLYEFGSGISNAAFISFQGSLIPSFPLRLAAAYIDLPAGEINAAENRIRLKDFDIPLWKGHQLIKFTRKGDRFSTYTFADLFQRRDLPSLQGKIVLIGFNLKGGKRITTPLWGAVGESQFHAGVLDSILNRSFVSRPSFLRHVETLAILILGALCAFFFPRMGEMRRLGGAVGLVALALVVQAFVLARLDVWVMIASFGAAIIAIYAFTTIWRRFVSLQANWDSQSADRAIGQSFQSQGLLDLALEKFCKLPLDGETKNLIYNVGLEYEKKRFFSKALDAYEYISRDGAFRDLSFRIPRLQEVMKTSTLGSHVTLEANIPNGTPLEEVKRIGRYEILEVLGKGSMGLVYKALDPKINRLLAIKTIRFLDEFDDDVIQEIKERFFREAEIAGRLSHPSIVTIHDIGEDQDLTYMAMEYLEGDDLEKFVSKNNLLPLKKVIHVVANVAEALDFAHEADVIHRDIKPANIRLLKSGGVKVTDFGIARAISSSRTRTGVILGTPNYMSPEQIMGQKVDLRSDIFSLGVLFYQLLTGELPFQGDNLSGLLYQITQIKQPALKTFHPGIPQACEQIVDKALAKDPNERFKTAGQMAKVLKLLAFKIEQRRKRSSGDRRLQAGVK